MAWLANLFLKRPSVLVALLMGLCALAGVGVSRLEIDDKPSSLFRSDDEEFRRLEEVWDNFGSDDGDVLLFVRSERLLEREGGLALAELTRAAAATPGVRSAVSPSSLIQRGPLGLLPIPVWPTQDAEGASWEALASVLADHPLARQLLSEDGRSALVVAQLEGRDMKVDDLRAPVERLQELAARVTSEGQLQVQATGIPPLRIVIFDAIRREQTLFALLGGLLGMLVGALVFRRIGPVLVTSAASIVAAFWGLGTLGLSGDRLNLMNTQLPLLILVIAFTDSVHLMVHILRRREAGLSPMQAGASAIRELGLPCALTSLTTAIGFLSLSLSRVEVIRHFGVLFAMSVALTFLAVLILVPLLSAWFLKDTRGESMSERYSGLHGPAERIMRAVMRRRVAVSWIGGLLTLGMALLSLQLKPENRLTEVVPDDQEAVHVLGEVEQAFGGSLWSAILVEWDADAAEGQVPEGLALALQHIEQMLENEPFCHGPLSARALAQVTRGDETLLDRVADLPQGLGRRYLQPDKGRALVSYTVPDAGSDVTEPAYQRLESNMRQLREAHPDFGLHITGTGYVARRNVNLIIVDFSRGLWLAAGVIVLVLAAAFRSWRLGLVAVLPNVFPLAVAGSVLVALGIQLQVASVLAFTVCLGIAVDDTIHLLARYQHERRAGLEPSEAAIQAFLHVGRALIATTLVLLCGFGVMFLSSIATSKLFALIAVIGLIAALLGDLILLPALLAATAPRERN
ncbi:MAG: putative RND superfamily exporter protein [Planctomycetota bacterium]|jgi:predicted RND superfamily exporter protein